MATREIRTNDKIDFNRRFPSSDGTFCFFVPDATRNWFCHAIASSNDWASHCPWLVMIVGSLPSQHVSVLRHQFQKRASFSPLETTTRIILRNVRVLTLFTQQVIIKSHSLGIPKCVSDILQVDLEEY